jgi:hypothetical protein
LKDWSAELGLLEDDDREDSERPGT